MSFYEVEIKIINSLPISASAGVYLKEWSAEWNHELGAQIRELGHP